MDVVLPRRPWLVLLVGVGGILAAYAWSSELADREIGYSVANCLLGHDANTTPIDRVSAGILFAFVTGLAGSFTT